MKKDEKTSVQEIFKELDKVIDAMEKDNVSLEDSFQLYKNGIDLVKQCSEQIDYIEKQIQLIDEEGEVYDFGN